DRTAALIDYLPLLARGVGVRLLGDVGSTAGARDLEHQAAVPRPDPVVATTGVEEVELLVGRAGDRPLPQGGTGGGGRVGDFGGLAAVLGHQPVVDTDLHRVAGGRAVQGGEHRVVSRLLVAAAVEQQRVLVPAPGVAVPHAPR